jgi:hypothetical protein
MSRDRVASKFASFLKRNIEPAGYLYRHYSPSGDLLYVGLTQSLSKRTNTHLAKATWKDFICVIVIEPFATREELLEAFSAAANRRKRALPAIAGAIGGSTGAGWCCWL